MRQLRIVKQITNHETESLERYLQEIGKIDLITADEEVRLTQRIKEGDQGALDKIAKQYQHKGLSLGISSMKGMLVW